MDIELLTRFFMWCSIINVALLLVSFLIVAFGFGSDFVYRVHSKWFPMPRETFNMVIYLLMAFYKMFIFVFNIVPWIALSIIK